MWEKGKIELLLRMISLGWKAEENILLIFRRPETVMATDDGEDCELWRHAAAGARIAPTCGRKEEAVSAHMYPEQRRNEESSALHGHLSAMIGGYYCDVN